MKIDNVFYAYKFINLIHYGLTLNVMRDIKSVNGYVVDFCYWRSYEWTDYFERIFNTRIKDVKMRMYTAMQVVK